MATGKSAWAAGLASALVLALAAAVLCAGAGQAGPSPSREAPDPARIARLAADVAADGPVRAAEALWRASDEGDLSPALLDLAAGLLASEDAFARGLAEWAIAAQVERDNRGQEVVWPKADAPAWFRAWAALPRETLLEMDYVRQAAAWGLHRDARAIAESAAKILRRAEAAAAETDQAGEPAEARAPAAVRLEALRSLAARLIRRVAEAPDDLPGHRRLWLDARRTARLLVLTRPAVDFHHIALVTGHPGHSLQNITGSQYPWTHKPGGDILVQDGLDPSAPVRPLLAGRLGPGHVHGIDLRWDADRVVFGWASQPTWPPRHDTVEGNHSFELRTDQPPTRLCEVWLDGTGLRQLTGDPVWSDFEPTYGASGDIVFASDRSGRSSECGKFSADHTVINLYRCGPDGEGVRRLNDNKDIDRYPRALDNGLIVYTRWDYQERHFFEIHSLWTVRPDGTMADALFKQHLRAPYGLRDARSVPGGPRLVAVATGHHTLAYGPVVLVDPTAGINAAEGLRLVTPDVLPQEGPAGGRPVPEGGVRDARGVYQTPWALSDRVFLVSYAGNRQTARQTDASRKASGFAIYLIDVYGNKELLHRDRLLSSTHPMPVRRRPRPPRLPDASDPAAPGATVYVADVHEGMPGVARGTVKHVRVMQRVGWPLDAKTGARRWIPGNAWEKQFGFWSWAPVRVIGTVPVEADGSAHFRVPADEAVYFQALDARHMEVRRMRTHVTFQRGEVRGCLGCHETRPVAPPPYASAATTASRRAADVPVPPPWGARRLLGYEWLVQPILDRHCARCHGADHPRGVDLTARRAPDGFVQSFRTLFGLRPGAPAPAAPLVSVSDRFGGAEVSAPMAFGSHRSPMIRTLLESERHRREVRLGEEEWLALVTWVDANAPYYDAFINKRPEGGGPPRRDTVVDLPEPFPPEVAAGPGAAVRGAPRTEKREDR